MRLLHHHLPVASLTLMAHSGIAQITTQAVLVTPLTVEAGSATALFPQTLPAGTTGPHAIGSFFQNASIQSTCLEGSGSMIAGTSWQLTAYSDTSLFARMPSAELVLTLQAPVATSVFVDLTSNLELTGTAMVPSYSIDYGDDGLLEVSPSTPPGTVLQTVIGPTPTTVRLRAEVDLVDLGSLDLALRVEVRPDNNLAVNNVVPPCQGDVLVIAPTFQNEGIEVLAFTVAPQVVVFGTSFQPLALPPLAGGTQCTLLPSVDVAVYVPVGAPLQVPLPQSIRPFALWVQGVALQPGGLTTSNAFSLVGL